MQKHGNVRPASSSVAERGAIAIEPIALEHDLAVPVHAERGEVPELLLGVGGRGVGAVEILHPHDEPAAGATGEQPGDERSAEVADVEVTGR